MAPRPKKIDDAPAAETLVEETVVEAPLRTFKLRELVDAEGEPVTRVSIGCAPRISIGTDETYTTTDPALADHLAATPELEETNA